MGDFNLSVAMVKRRFEQPLNLTRMTPVNGDMTRYATRRGRHIRSALDHILMSVHCTHAYVKVERDYDMSDHWPVRCWVDIQGDGIHDDFELVHSKLTSQDDWQTPRRRRVNTKKLSECSFRVATNNRWSLLAVEVEDVLQEVDKMEPGSVVTEAVERKVHQVGSSFTNVFSEVLSENNCWTDHGRRRRNRSRKGSRASKTLKQLINRRWLLYRNLSSEGIVARGDPRYRVLLKRCRKQVQKERLEAWIKFVDNGMAALKENDSKAHWRWIHLINGLGRNTQRCQSLCPVYDPQKPNKLATSGDEIREVWRGRYDRLLGTPGVQRSIDEWTALVLKEHDHVISRYPTMPSCDEPISIGELWQAIRASKKGKAPGLDAMPYELFQSVLDFNLESGIPPLLRCYHGLVNVIFRSCVITRCWQVSELLNVLKPRRDSSFVPSYRPISLIACGIKLLCWVLTHRIQSWLSEQQILTKLQAGFRRGEECMGHVVSLYEICKRRSNANKKTYVAFIDFENAYDKVSHEGLFAKLFFYGIRGRVLDFIIALYSNSYWKLRDDQEYKGKCSRGLRQGCTMSPIIFDLFINGLLVRLRNLGVHVQTRRRDSKVPGLLLADDVAVLASSRRTLMTALEWINAT